MLTLERVACRLRVRGLVQGVGFRPFVHRLATSLDLAGWVCNDDAGVLIHVEGEADAIEAFRARMMKHVPAAAQIESVVAEPADPEDAGGFQIRFQLVPKLEFGNESPAMQTRVPADRAICSLCRDEILDAANRRHRHPFATCTDCGPRYSILHSIPYERCHTSLHGFQMCARCEAEYENPGDRRFHAEPIACPACGPRLTLAEPSVVRPRTDWPAIVAAAEILWAGKIVALKGLGGYQLLVRADRDAAVLRLRQRKYRPSKPLAVMVRSIEQADRLARISPRERELLLSAENPIVLLPAKAMLCPAIAPRVGNAGSVGNVGLFLPTTPLHVLLLSLVDFPVVATSGNRSEEPIVIDENERASLASIADAFLDHDRPIVRRVDDSVVRVIDDRPMILRLARGYAPCTLPALERWAMASDGPIPTMIAVGGQQKTALALWTGHQAILSAHLGDMDHPEARRAFSATVDDFARLYGCAPKMIVGDLHPDYYTTRWAQNTGKPFLQVQHHHAHAATCMVEHDLLGREVLAVTWDGTGFGTDGTIWGGEILHASLQDFQRIAALDLFALPGGEAAIHEPNRIALSLLAETYGSEAIPAWLLDRLGFSADRACVLIQMIERQVNAPRTSSVGRLFDGVAALLLQIRDVSYEGEAALWLEEAVDPAECTAYPIALRPDPSPSASEGPTRFGSKTSDGLLRGDWRPLMRALVADLANETDVGVCAACFHNALATWAAAVVATSPLRDVVLGGGCFQNASLTCRTRAAIVELGKTVYVPSRVPPNDGGLAVGQLAIGMARYAGQ